MDTGRLSSREPLKPSRRIFLGTMGVAATSAATLSAMADAGSGQKPTPVNPPAVTGETYETQAKGIRILPGQWRPHYPWEQIAWVSPPWPSQDYLWLDFPEAIFTHQGLLYLSHINPQIPSVYSDLPGVPWRKTPKGVAFERTLPNNVAFGGSVTKETDSTVTLEIHIHNGSPEKLCRISLQTCAFLRAIKEFADFTNDNKFVHVLGSGWIPLSQALGLADANAPYRVGWRTDGRTVADAPIAVAVSNEGSRLLAFTWGQDTLSMVGNPRHPCIHADPHFQDLEPGQRGSVQGKLTFFEGQLSDFDCTTL